MNNDVISKPVLSTTINKITNNSYLASRVNSFIPNPDTEWGLPWEVSGIAEHVANIAAWVKPWNPAKFGCFSAMQARVSKLVTNKTTWWLDNASNCPQEAAGSPLDFQGLQFYATQFND